MVENTTTHTPYYQGAGRSVIQVPTPHKGGFIAWNWNTHSWDDLDAAIPDAPVAEEVEVRD